MILSCLGPEAAKQPQTIMVLHHTQLKTDNVNSFREINFVFFQLK